MATSERCPRCDRPECDAKDATDAYYAATSVDDRIATMQRHGGAVGECHRHAIDWRARCLAAEAERDRMRSVVEAAEAWGVWPFPWRHDHSEPCRDVEWKLAMAVDEWRRTETSRGGDRG